jgi:hypothetical protein
VHETAQAPEATTRPAYVLTGRLPPAERVRAPAAEAHARFRDEDEGHNAAHGPARRRRRAAEGRAAEGRAAEGRAAEGRAAEGRAAEERRDAKR